MKKIEQIGVNEESITFIKAYLAERSAIVVVVNGKSSSKMRLSNMIFQGTVLGPLWNVFIQNLDDAIVDESDSINKVAHGQ